MRSEAQYQINSDDDGHHQNHHHIPMIIEK